MCQVNMYFNVQLKGMQSVFCSAQTSFQLTFQEHFLSRLTDTQFRFSLHPRDFYCFPVIVSLGFRVSPA